MLFASGVGRVQSFLASVSGIVNDPTGAVAPNVKITVTDTERGVPFTTPANQTVEVQSQVQMVDLSNATLGVLRS